MTSKSFLFSINEKTNRSNFATLNFLHEFFTHLFFASILKFALIFNKKFVDSKIIYQSFETKIKKFKNKNVFFFQKIFAQMSSL